MSARFSGSNLRPRPLLLGQARVLRRRHRQPRARLRVDRLRQVERAPAELWFRGTAA